MKRILKNFVFACAPALFAASQAAAGGFVQITPPAGSIDAGVIAINDQGEVGGSYTTDGADQLGFIGSIDGNYTTFTVNGEGTQVRALNNQGRSVGITFPPGSVNQFDRAKNGTATLITKDGAPLIGISGGLSPSGDFVGDYLGEPGSMPLRGGYSGKNAAYQANVTLPFPAIRVAPRGVNARGDIAGWFIGEPGLAPQGFVMKNGETTVLNHPDAVLTYVQGINNKGEMSGSWEDAAGNSHGFHLAADLVTWTSFDAPVGDFTQAFQINNHGQIVVNGNGATESGIFVWCPKNVGICKPNNQVAATEKRSRGQANQNRPDASRRAADPDTRGRGHKN